MKKKLLLLCISIAVNVCVVHTQTTTLFTSPENGNYYRIPALATAFDGTLISVTDLRYNDNKDLGNHRIDLLVRRSSDYGTTWSAAVNLTYSHTTSTTGFGDAALVADCESGDVLIICASGSNTYQTGKLNVSRLVSHDNGISWSAPTDITSNIYDLNSSWKSLFFASGRICQSRIIKKGSHYRLYAAILAHNSLLYATLNKYGNAVIYSDDFGETWHPLGGTITCAAPDGDEAKIEELADGSLILSSRKSGGRYFRKFIYNNMDVGTGSWQGLVSSTNGSTNPCNGELLRVNARNASGNQVQLLLQTQPTGTDRHNIKLSYCTYNTNSNLATDWTNAPQSIAPNYAAYSTMCLLANGKIGIYWEDNGTNSNGNDGFNMLFRAYDLNELVPGHTIGLPIPTIKISYYTATLQPANNTLLMQVPIGTDLATFITQTMDVKSAMDIRTNISAFTLTGGRATAIVTLSEGNYHETYNLVIEACINENAPNIWLGITADWHTASNWSKGNVPLPTERVILPSSKSIYPEIGIGGAACHEIFIQGGARLGNSFRLTYNEAYVEVEVPTNQWVRLTSQLHNTLSGDFYTSGQGGGYENAADAPFSRSAYNSVVEGSNELAANRIFPGSTYQRIFSEWVPTHMGSSFVSEWSDPYNALSYEYKKIEGYDVWIDDDNATKATFHFPASDTEYNYFYNSGLESEYKETAVRSAAHGKFVYTTEDVTYGNMEYTVKRDTESETPLYAIGNPSFAYMDVKEFLKMNLTLTPFVYRHIESPTVGAGEGSEVILYLNRNSGELHKVLSKNELSINALNSDSLQDIDDAMLQYIAPGRGFRVMGGDFKPLCIEPKLLGYYSDAEFNLAPVSWTRTGFLVNDKNTNSQYISAYTINNETGNPYSSPITISATNDPTIVRISGLVNQATALAKVDATAQTITIKNGTAASFTGSSSWSSATTLYLYGCTSNQFIFSTTLKEYSDILGYKRKSTYPTNLGVDIVFNYTIDEATGNIRITTTKPFVLFDDQTPSGLHSTTTSDNLYPVMFFCFQSFTAQRTHTLHGEDFINKNALGNYSYTSSSGTVNVTINRIVGTYDMVSIKGIHPSAPEVEIVGQIKNNSGTYTLTIPPGQMALEGSTIQNNRYLYVRNSRSTAITHTLSGRNWTMSDRIMISALNSNSDNFTSTSNFNLIYVSDLTGSTSTGITPTDDYTQLYLKYTGKMFTANLPAGVQSAPAQRTEGSSSSVATIEAAYGLLNINTLLVSSTGASNAFNINEDAPMLDCEDSDLYLGSMAGEQMVAVNSLYRPDSVALALRGIDGPASLQFNNLIAIADTTYLYDSREGNIYQLNNTNSSLSFYTSSSDAIDRFVLRFKYAAQVSSGLVEGSSCELLVINSTANSVTVISNNNDLIESLKLYNTQGQLLQQLTPNNNEVTINNLIAGVYLICTETSGGKIETQKIVIR